MASTSPSAARRTFSDRLKTPARLLFVAALVHPLAQLPARLDWRIDLLTHFEAQAFAVTLIALAFAVIARTRLALLTLAILAAFQLAPLVRYSVGNPVAAGPGKPLRILSANVLFNNEDHASLAKLIEREDPDVVGLIEVTHDWIADLAAIRARYPYRLEAPTYEGATGLALWLRKPPVAIEGPLKPTAAGWPYLKAKIDYEGRIITLFLVHPSNPLRRRGAAGQAEFDALADLARAEAGPTIVIGDLNCTEGSPYFGDFLARSGLRDSRLGFGKQPSWPGNPLLRIPIDHAFVSSDMAVVERRLGPAIGSDHFPLFLGVAPARLGGDSRK